MEVSKQEVQCFERVHDSVHAKPMPDCHTGLDIHPYAIAKIVENPSPAIRNSLVSAPVKKTMKSADLKIDSPEG